jgi:alkylation response protein AidB-like acyl-CoA dehydrogenase
VNGKPRKQITAFIVETSWPGVEVAHRCRFMGLKAIENGVIKFENVKVPAENILWGEGKGLKLALITLNTGRLTLPASAAGGAKMMLAMSRTWAKQRVQWGAPIGKHEAIAQKLGKMAAHAFAMEAVAELASALADRGDYDIRLEAAIAKMYNTEAGWRIVDDALQIRGGRGYETSDSLRARGEIPFPIERAMRDFRINLIFEGSSEIMRLFIAREAVDHHFSTAFDVVNPKATRAERMAAIGRSIKFYPTWYASRWLGTGQLKSWDAPDKLAGHLRYLERTTRKLGRAIFHAMVRLGPKLEKRQMVLFRAVDIGAELFAMAATCSRAQMLAERGDKNAILLADLFCREARLRVSDLFANMYGKNDGALYKTAQRVLNGEFEWLERGTIGLGLDLQSSGMDAEAPMEEREAVGAGG